MKKFIFVDSFGNPQYTASPETDDAYISGEAYGDCTCFEVPVDLDDLFILSRCYVKAGALKERTERPDFHEWDIDSESWLPNLDAARSAKLQEVSAELNRSLYLPCNGFDADKVSRDRISGMIARLQRGDGLPNGWVGWRDASNQQQWATDDAATVLSNLTALSRAIEDREQALLIAAWAHKDNIEALTDIDAILAYDVTKNWPT